MFDVVIAVRHPIMRRGVAAVIEDTATMRLAGAASDLAGLKALCASERPKVALVDETLPGLRLGSQFSAIIDEHRDTRFLMLSLYERRHVHGRKQHCHIQVDSTWQDASALVLSIASELAANPKCDKPLEVLQERQNVTPRENEVLVLVAQGFTNSEIAEQLSISPRTAELHRFRLQRKLGVRTPIDLAKYVLRAGLVPM